LGATYDIPKAKKKKKKKKKKKHKKKKRHRQSPMWFLNHNPDQNQEEKNCCGRSQKKTPGKRLEKPTERQPRKKVNVTKVGGQKKTPARKEAKHGVPSIHREQRWGKQTRGETASCGRGV